MDERILTITLSDEPSVPLPNIWERIIGKWNEMSTIQKALIIFTSFGSGACAVILSKGGEEEKVVE